MDLSFDSGDKNYRGVFLQFEANQPKREILRQKHGLGYDIDNRILCFNCDQRIGKWEDVAKVALLDGRGLVTQSRTVLQNFLIENVDGLPYREIKLTLLAMLWRLSVSDARLAAAVSLGPHEQRIKQMLITEDPGDDNTYPSVISRVTLQGKPFGMSVAYGSRIDGQRCVFVWAGGLRILTFTRRLSPNGPLRGFYDLRIKATGSTTITVENAESQEAIINMIRQGKASPVSSTPMW
jgi:hypothetical protein